VVVSDISVHEAYPLFILSHMAIMRGINFTVPGWPRQEINKAEI
jgi:hypothetical protein